MNAAIMRDSFERLLGMARESAGRSRALHEQFLHARRAAQQNMRALIEMQIRGGKMLRDSLPFGDSSPSRERLPLFDSSQLDEFGAGRISACLGPAFARYDGRRIPRIPNGDLKMMSRVVEISGRSGDFNTPASIVVEYDVPPDAWYLHDNASPQIPDSLWMEIALQPCGFLSAYLDTYALVPYGSFYFRNLDGRLQSLGTAREIQDVRGKTVVTQARLLSNAVSGGTVIQKYAFEITCAGRPLYAGESIFGYFSVEAMANQVGLDGGRATLPALRADSMQPAGASLSQCAARVDLRRFLPAAPNRPRLARERLHFLDEIFVSPDGGRFGKGYVYASRPVDPQDWYYPYHFYQDPVMPGSLGVQAVLEAMQGFALACDLHRGLRAPYFGPVPGAAPMTWRYRGQITRQHKLMELEVHPSVIERSAAGISLLGDASLWVDGLRIYEVKNAAVGISEG